MSRILFFGIPAHGHTNPTIEVVRELTSRGHEVWYCSFDAFRHKIEAAGGQFLSCDKYLPPAPADIEKKVGRDFASLIEMTVDTTLRMEQAVFEMLKRWKPDCIVSDSMCTWGKLFARKHNIPFVCSTTTFAFNRYTARLMKPGIGEVLRMAAGMPRIHAKMKRLQEHGYAVSNVQQLIENDNDIHTIVYTSREFQPMAETFSEKYLFVGPSVADITVKKRPAQKPLLYISMGTVLNKNDTFYRNCIKAFSGCEIDVILSVGEKTKISALGKIPSHIMVRSSVNQLEILQRADVFLTHCGMNSVNESIYYGVPMVLFPQHSEEGLVAMRAEQTGTGLRLKSIRPSRLRKAVFKVLETEAYRQNAQRISHTFHNAGGAPKAADMIEKVSGC